MILILISTFISDILQKSIIIVTILLCFFILHLHTQPFLTKNMNRFNLESDIVLFFIFITESFKHSFSDDSIFIQYFAFTVVLILKMYIILQIIKWIICIFIVNHKKLLNQLKKIVYLDGKVLKL